MISLREFVRPVWAPHPRHRHVKPAFAQKERRFASTLHTKDVNSLVVSALKSDESQEVVTNGASPPEEQGGKGVPAEANFLAGNACLLVVSLLWGSYNPALRAVFTLPGGPDPLVVAAARGLLQAVLLGGATYLTFLATQHNKAQDEPKAPKTQSNGSGSQKPLTIPRNILSGIEIGLYNTCGTLLQTWGLSVSSSTRAAFLIQATALWTPGLAAAFGLAPSPLLWASSLTALLSTLLVTFDQADGAGPAGDLVSSSLLGNLSVGDLATLAAAFFYSLATVRIPMYSSGPNAVPPLQLALGKSSVLALVSTTVLSIKALTIAAHGAPLTELWPAGPSQPLAWGIIAWSAAGPGALSAYLHVKGQSMVGPTDAQIVFSTVPLWSALLAAWFLPGEQVGPLSWAGGALMVLAGLIGALGQTKFSGYVREKGKSE